MIERVQVDTFVKELGDGPGMSKPVQVICKGKNYILKTPYVYNENRKDWELWDSMFVQEVLVYQIAKYLGVPIPDCAIADVNQEFLNKAPALRFTHRYSTGNHFASKLIGGLENNLRDGYILLMKMGKPYIKTSWTNFYKKISNPYDIPKIIVLDLLTANFDRFGNTGNLIIASENGVRKVYVIDHGHCFWGASWNNIEKQEKMRKAANDDAYITMYIQDLLNYSGSPLSGLGALFRAVDQHIDISDPKDHCFIDIVHKIEGITPSMIDSWFTEIPDEWFVQKSNQIALYKHFLLKQKDLLRSLICKMDFYGAFNNRTGGELLWNEKPTGTQ